MQIAGLSVDDVWPGIPDSERNIWTAKVYVLNEPISDNRHDIPVAAACYQMPELLRYRYQLSETIWMQDLSRNMADTTTLSANINIWKSARRLSLADVLLHCDPKCMSTWREIILLSISNHNKIVNIPVYVVPRYDLYASEGVVADNLLSKGSSIFLPYTENILRPDILASNINSMRNCFLQIRSEYRDDFYNIRKTKIFTAILSDVYLLAITCAYMLISAKASRSNDTRDMNSYIDLFVEMIENFIMREYPRKYATMFINSSLYSILGLLKKLPHDIVVHIALFLHLSSRIEDRLALVKIFLFEHAIDRTSVALHPRLLLICGWLVQVIISHPIYRPPNLLTGCLVTRPQT